MWIELPWPENPENICTWHTETLDSWFDLIRSYQQCISCFPHWRSNQQPKNAELKLYHWATCPHHTQTMQNQLIMVIARPIKLNGSCKLHPYSTQRTQSAPGPCLPRRIGNTHPCNYYNLKCKDIDMHFHFLRRGIILWIELPWPENFLVMVIQFMGTHVNPQAKFTLTSSSA